MLEIVERILAALIILALLTLLIILAFPVPARSPVAPTPSGDGQQEAQRREETKPAPVTETKPAPTKPAETKPPEPKPVEKPAEPKPVELKKADRLPIEKDAPPRKPASTVFAKGDSERIDRAETHARRNSSEAPKGYPIRRVERDAIIEDCPEDDCDCFVKPARRRPFWAEPPPRRVVERRYRPYWAQLPAGACPE